MFQVYTTVPSPLQCWGLCWSLPCWQEQPGLHIRRTPCVFGGFPPLAASITDSLEHIETQTEMCWLLTWVHILDNNTQRLRFFVFFFFNLLLRTLLWSCASASSLGFPYNDRELALPSRLNASHSLANLRWYSEVFNMACGCEDVIFILFPVESTLKLFIFEAHTLYVEERMLEVFFFFISGTEHFIICCILVLWWAFLFCCTFCRHFFILWCPYGSAILSVL